MKNYVKYAVCAMFALAVIGAYALFLPQESLAKVKMIYYQYVGVNNDNDTPDNHVCKTTGCRYGYHKNLIVPSWRPLTEKNPHLPPNEYFIEVLEEDRATVLFSDPQEVERFELTGQQLDQIPPGKKAGDTFRAAWRGNTQDLNQRLVASSLTVE